MLYLLTVAFTKYLNEDDENVIVIFFSFHL